jgi:hypothetical protein
VGIRGTPAFPSRHSVIHRHSLTHNQKGLEGPLNTSFPSSLRPSTLPSAPHKDCLPPVMRAYQSLPLLESRKAQPPKFSIPYARDLISRSCETPGVPLTPALTLYLAPFASKPHLLLGTSPQGLPRLIGNSRS